MSLVDNIIIQVRARLQQLCIKLWQEPYYYDGIGCVEEEIDKLANSFSQDLSISVSKCKLALTELQEGALRKLAARKEFETSGIATFTIRRVNSQNGTQNIIEVKCPLKALGSELHEIVAKSLNITNASRIKCISDAKIIDPNRSLEVQNIKNNQQLMVIISEVDTVAQNQEDAMHDRIRTIKQDVESIVDSNRQLFEMEDQDGNPVFLPPTENRALLMALGYYEKARAAIKRNSYDEALVLLLEADEKFLTCNSKFLESVDNYALVNLDIVWCYLCLKNVSLLPDAQRRLDLCEKSFHRSYGENFQRLVSLKGNACPEKALIVRLHLLQGVVLFHQNRRNESYEKFVEAETELEALKVSETSVGTLVEMGYEPIEARLALRSCNGNLEQSVNFIHDRKEKLRESRMKSENERKINMNLSSATDDKEWVNPRSVCTLLDMGFEGDIVVEALKRCNNDVPKALDLLQSHADELRQNLPPPVLSADNVILSHLTQLGFNEEMARIALETTHNNLDSSIEFLLKLCGDEKQLEAVINHMKECAGNSAADINIEGPSTSSGAGTILSKALEKAQKEMEVLKSYNRFAEEINAHEQDYLDLSLVQEEQILAEYKRLLEQ